MVIVFYSNSIRSILLLKKFGWQSEKLVDIKVKPRLPFFVCSKMLFRIERMLKSSIESIKIKSISSFSFTSGTQINFLSQRQVEVKLGFY